MKTQKHRIVEFPRSRIATFDIGAPMARFINALTANIENGTGV